MRSVRRGRSTSGVEVTNVSANGLWLLLDGEEVFVAFKHFPWFRDASIGQLLKVKRPAAHHLCWPDLDVDVAVESLANPERYPLVSRVRPGDRTPRRVSRGAKVAKKRRGPAGRSRR